MKGTIKRIAAEAAWAPLTVLLAHAVGARIYGHEPVVDPVMHFSGGVAVAFFFRRSAAIASDFVGGLTSFGLDALAFGLACSSVLLWEVGEFASGQILGSHARRSLDNTMRDLILGMAGAVSLLTGGFAVRHGAHVK